MFSVVILEATMFQFGPSDSEYGGGSILIMIEGVRKNFGLMSDLHRLMFHFPLNCSVTSSPNKGISGTRSVKLLLEKSLLENDD